MTAEIIQKLLKNHNPENLLEIALFTSLVALIAAYVSQYVFGLEPCQLCFWQRKPFFAIIILTGLVLFIPFLQKWQQLAVKLCIILFVLNAAIAFYHFGVEQKWFTGLDSCSLQNIAATTVDELMAQLENTKIARCDEPQFIFLDLSMAGWNVFYCLFWAVFLGIGFRKNKY
jgi:disulfide bond formation protein DsbB